MADRTKFEDLSDDLFCMLLHWQKLSGRHTRTSIKGLASFTCVSSRYSRLVKERSSGLWEGVCREAFLEMCMRLAPSGGSPGDAGWASFAKLLAWCPGHRELSVTEKAGNASKGHLVNWVDVIGEEEFFSDASKCRAEYVLCCEQHEDSCALPQELDFDGRGFGVIYMTNIIYRGFIGDVQAWAADSGIKLFGAEGTRAEEGSAGSENTKEVGCPFCPSPVHWILPQRVTARPFASANFLVCSTGHIHGPSFWSLSGSMSHGGVDRVQPI
jgi:hypothetical protein